jgi:hypothetical protein
MEQSTKISKEKTVVTLSGGPAVARYRAFFGSHVSDVVTGGIAAYAATL